MEVEEDPVPWIPDVPFSDISASNQAKTNNQLTNKNFKLRKKVKRLQREIKGLRKSFENSKNVKSLYRIFNKEQVSVLCHSKKKCPRWSVSSVSKALKVRAAGGRKALNKTGLIGGQRP